MQDANIIGRKCTQFHISDLYRQDFVIVNDWKNLLQFPTFNLKEVTTNLKTEFCDFVIML